VKVPAVGTAAEYERCHDVKGRRHFRTPRGCFELRFKILSGRPFAELVKQAPLLRPLSESHARAPAAILLDERLLPMRDGDGKRRSQANRGGGSNGNHDFSHSVPRQSTLHGF